MLTAIISDGLSVRAKEILAQALDMAYGAGSVSIDEVQKEKIRMKVRVSLKSPAVVLVVLDTIAEDYCSKIENGLYSSDKYCLYESDKSFVQTLNEKYSLSFSIPDEEVLEEVEEQKGYDEEEVNRIIREHDISKDMIISLKNSRIKELEERVKELEHYRFLYEEEEDRKNGGNLLGGSELSEVKRDVVPREDYQLLVEKNEKLRGEVMDLQASLSESKDLVKRLEKEKTEDSEVDSKLQGNYERVKNELAELRQSYTMQSSLVKSKDEKIASLFSQISTSEGSLINKDKAIANLTETISGLRSDLGNVREDLQTKEREIGRLYKEIADLRVNQVPEDLVNSLRSEAEDLTKENESLRKEVSAKNQKIEELESNLTGLKQELEEKKGSLIRVESRSKEDSKTISELNKELLSVKSELSYFKKDGVELTEDESSAEYVRLKKDYIKLRDSVFGKLSVSSKPYSPLKDVQILKNMSVNMKFGRMGFIFAGNTESRNGMYKYLSNDVFINVRNNSNVNILIVDLVSETVADKYFGIEKAVTGIDWFRKGGNVQPYLSSTSSPNVKVLMSGVGYVNDVYFLTIDWEKRLKELERSGYMVLVVCGDLSNVVGRIFHESFATHGDSCIYVKGNASCSRSLLASIFGISNSSYSKVFFFDYIRETAERFYNEIAKRNECKILSRQKYVGSTRK